MPRPGAMRVQEKSKDFKKSFLRLLKNLKPWKYLMLMSLFLALVSSLLTLLCPNKLSELTDSISKGIYPSESRLELVMQQASQNLKSGNIINKMQELLINSSLSETETTQIKAVLDKIQSSSNPNEFQMDILNLPDSVLIQLFEEIKIDDITISVIDQLSMIKLFASNENNDVLAKFNQLPDSIKTVIIPYLTVVCQPIQ